MDLEWGSTSKVSRNEGSHQMPSEAQHFELLRRRPASLAPSSRVSSNKAGSEVPFPVVVTGKLRRDVLEALPGLLVPFECLGYADRVSVAHGAVTAQRRRGIHGIMSSYTRVHAKRSRGLQARKQTSKKTVNIRIGQGVFNQKI